MRILKVLSVALTALLLSSWASTSAADPSKRLADEERSKNTQEFVDSSLIKQLSDEKLAADEPLRTQECLASALIIDFADAFSNISGQGVRSGYSTERVTQLKTHFSERLDSMVTPEVDLESLRQPVDRTSGLLLMLLPLPDQRVPKLMATDASITLKQCEQLAELNAPAAEGQK